MPVTHLPPDVPEPRFDAGGLDESAHHVAKVVARQRSAHPDDAGKDRVGQLALSPGTTDRVEQYAVPIARTEVSATEPVAVRHESSKAATTGHG